jgi:OOP family OmpA-OmpF porin
MDRRKAGIAVSVLALCLLTLGSGVAQDKVKGQGVITGKSGDNLTLDTDEDVSITLVVTPDTKIYHSVGLGGRRKQVGQDVLIPGLKLKYWGTGDPSRVSVDQIYFDRDDLSLAKVIQAGLNPTAQQTAVHAQQIATGKAAIEANQAAIAASAQEIEANKQRIAANQSNLDEVARSTSERFSQLGEYSVRDQTTVYFESGDYAISDAHKQALAALAKEALDNGNKAYLIQVSAFADSSGQAASNQELSKDRAEAVVAYLIQECGVPVGRIVSPGALGETNPAASNESKEGRSQNRRAEVKLLINKGISGSGSN